MGYEYSYPQQMHESTLVRYGRLSKISSNTMQAWHHRLAYLTAINLYSVQLLGSYENNRQSSMMIPIVY